MEKYSVLISVYNKEKPEFLFLAIKSMIEQTVFPDEIVLIKDGKLNDNLEKVINDFALKYPNLFKILQNEKNIGLGLSLKKGILMCKNELIARMDSDDISRSDRIEKQLTFFKNNPEFAICGGQIQEFCGNKIVGIRKVPLEDKEIKDYMKKRCPFNHMSVMYKKSAVLLAGNYQHFPYNEDYKLWIDMFNAKLKMANLSDILVDVRVDNSMYERRGGKVYFKSEKKIQDIMKKCQIIDNKTYLLNILKRIIVQKICPNKVRAFIFKKFARS